MRALPPIPDFSILFPVTSIVLDLTNACMLYKTQDPKFLQFQILAKQSKQIPEVHPWQPLQ